MDSGRKYVVYTCITGGYDTLKPIPKNIYDKATAMGIDFLCVTDNVALYSSNPGNWSLVEMPEQLNQLLQQNKVKAQRLVKILPMKFLPADYYASLWVDANMEVSGDITSFFTEYDLDRFPLWTNRHPNRKCIYDEEAAVIRMRKDEPEVCKAQIEAYMAERYPVDNGLAETNMMLRRHDDPLVRKTCYLWAEQIVKWSKRDQLSFNYCCWKTGLKYGEFQSVRNTEKILKRFQHKALKEQAKNLQKSSENENATQESKISPMAEEKPLSQQKPLKIAVYTCIVGCYEKLKTPNYITKGIDYICFTDNPKMKVEGWETRLIPPTLLLVKENKRQRIVKIRPDRYLPEYDITLWVDGNIDINCNIFDLLKKYPIEKSALYICQHKQRKSVKDEAIAVVKLKKDIKENVDKQMLFYKHENYSCDTGMVESNVILRNSRDKNCIRMLDVWEKTLLRFSHRDQLSFNYACWKTKFPYKTFNDVFRVSTPRDFNVVPHVKTTPTISFVTINYNTSTLVNAWLKSIFKQQPDIGKYKVCIFDKSDNEKLDTSLIDSKHVDVIDNTGGKYIDFNGKSFLDLCKSPTENQHASLKHCYTIQWLLDNMDSDAIVLFDSDTILKKPLDFLGPRNFSKLSLFDTDKNKALVRAVPFLQYFNLNLLKCSKLKYFDPYRIRGGLNEFNSSIYDTGASFYEDVVKSNFMLACGLIKADDYISHLHHGSWVKAGKPADIKGFLLKNKQYL